MTRAHFNSLSPEQLEALAILSEECGEVIQIIGKILRHGLDSSHPDGGPMNFQLLSKELGDVQAAVLLCRQQRILNAGDIERARDQKLRNVGKYLHHIQPLDAARLALSPPATEQEK